MIKSLQFLIRNDNSLIRGNNFSLSDIDGSYKKDVGRLDVLIKKDRGDLQLIFCPNKSLG